MKYFILSLFLSSAFAQTSELKTFKTDYCTNYPEGTPAHPNLWKHCCLMHDMFFWAGGTPSERVAADKHLLACVEATGEPRHARLMYSAIRLTSYSPIKYPDKRWGNGWENRDDLQKLSVEEIAKIEDELMTGYDFIDPVHRDEVLGILKSR